MSMIKVENLTFSYPSSYDPIFENVSFQIDTDWKLGFVGRNGRGKTTFLNLLMDQYEYRGKIIKSVRFDYFPYPVKDTKKWTMEVLNEVCPQAEEWQIRKELYALEVDEEVLWRPFETLSNGEQTKALLAALFLKEGHFLLIDEPTNHLDTHGRQIVSEYLRKKKGFILVSHDRCFLDGCVDHILSLNRSNIEVQRGTFSAFLQNFEQQQRLEEAQNASLKKDIRRLSQSAKRTQGWSDRVEASKTGAADKGYIGHKSAKMMKRAKSIEARQQKAIEQKSGLLKNRERAEELKLLPLQYRSDTLVTFLDAAVCYGGIRSAVRCPFQSIEENGWYWMEVMEVGKAACSNSWREKLWSIQGRLRWDLDLSFLMYRRIRHICRGHFLILRKRARSRKLYSKQSCGNWILRGLSLKRKYRIFPVDRRKRC